MCGRGISESRAIGARTRSERADMGVVIDADGDWIISSLGMEIRESHDLIKPLPGAVLHTLAREWRPGSFSSATASAKDRGRALLSREGRKRARRRMHILRSNGNNDSFKHSTISTVLVGAGPRAETTLATVHSRPCNPFTSSSVVGALKPEERKRSYQCYTHA